MPQTDDQVTDQVPEGSRKRVRKAVSAGQDTTPGARVQCDTDESGKEIPPLSMIGSSGGQLRPGSKKWKRMQALQAAASLSAADPDAKDYMTTTRKVKLGQIPLPAVPPGTKGDILSAPTSAGTSPAQGGEVAWNEMKPGETAQEAVNRKVSLTALRRASIQQMLAEAGEKQLLMASQGTLLQPTGFKLPSMEGWSHKRDIERLKEMEKDEEAQEEIYAAIAGGASLRDVGTAVGVSLGMLHRWLHGDGERERRYVSAQEARAEAILAASEDLERLTVTGVVPAEVARVVIDSIKWRAGKMYQRKYGDKVQVEASGSVTLNLGLPTRVPTTAVAMDAVQSPPAIARKPASSLAGPTDTRSDTVVDLVPGAIQPASKPADLSHQVDPDATA